jgi:hypothetical protein
MSSRRKLAIAISVLAACSIAGGAYAATSGSTPQQTFLNDVAKRLNVNPQRLSSALQAAFGDELQAAVKAGKLTEAQAKAIEQRVHDRGFPPFPFLFRHALPFGGPMLHGGPLLHGGIVSAAAAYIGISERQLWGQLQSGKSLAQVAAAHGKSATGLERALASALRAKLDGARSAGMLTQQMEQRLLNRLQSRLGVLINRAGLFPHFGPWLGPRRAPWSVTPAPGELPGSPPAPAPLY